VILRRLKIDGFGALTGAWTFEPGALHLIVAENERGKTTLAAAIAAALFGLDADKRSWRDRATPLEQHRPWSGRPYALELEFELAHKRYVVNRHFGNGRLTVLQDGKDVTETFRHGSGEYKLGEELLGMSADQFARSALWLQPGPGRLGGSDVRPDGTLTALLEAMASSVQGDTTAAQAIAVLDEALKNYRGVQQSGMIVNEIKKLEIALGTIAVDLNAAQSDRETLASDLARMAEFEDRESGLGARLLAARHGGARRRLGEIDEALKKDDTERAQLFAWRSELDRLAPARAVPDDAPEHLQSAQAELAAGLRTLDDVRAELARDIAAPRLEVETALTTCSAFTGAEPRHIEELHALEKDLERARQLAKSAEEKRVELEKELTARGVPVARAAELSAHFGTLSAEDRGLLTQFPAQTQHLVTESETAQRAAQDGQSLIEEIGRQRGRMRGFGFGAGVLGLLAGTAAVWLALAGRSIESFVGLGITLVALAAATLLLLRSTSHRDADRKGALEQVVEAQRRSGEVRQRRQEREDALARMAKKIGFPDVTSLLRDFGESQRLTAEVQRFDWIDQDRARAVEDGARVETDVKDRLRRAGLDPGLPPHEAFARLRLGIGSVLEARSRSARLDELENGLLAREKAALARVAEARGRIRALAEVLGLSAPTDDAFEALAEAVTQKAVERRRLDTLEGELVPAAAVRVLAEEVRAALERERPSLVAEVAAVGDTVPAPSAAALAADAPTDAVALERELEEVRRALIELHSRVGGREGATAKRVAELLADRDRKHGALERARAFKAAVELARDRFQTVARETHARWSEHLAGRVDELLARFGLEHAGFRLSDKLELSLTLDGDRLTGGRLEQSLSTGARDQVALALRIAICEFLARGGAKLPLLLDDPLAHADDARAGRLLRVLAEAARTGHQVLVLTCHRATVDALREEDSAWFDEAVRVVGFDSPRAARPA